MQYTCSFYSTVFGCVCVRDGHVGWAGFFFGGGCIFSIIIAVCVGVCVDERSHHKYRIFCVCVHVVGWCAAVSVWVRDTVRGLDFLFLWVCVSDFGGRVVRRHVTCVCMMMGINGSWFERCILIKELLLPQVDGAHEFSLREAAMGCAAATDVYLFVFVFVLFAQVPEFALRQVKLESTQVVSLGSSVAPRTVICVSGMSCPSSMYIHISISTFIYIYVYMLHCVSLSMCWAAV